MAPEDQEMGVNDEVSKYSVLVGVVLIVVFVVPCVMFALLAKYFQSPDRVRRASTFRSLVGSFRLTSEAREEGLHRINSAIGGKKLADSDSCAYGTYGIVEISPDKLEAIEKIITFKAKVACIETWKCYAPDALCNHGDDRKFITIKRLGSSTSYSGREHSQCLRCELDCLNDIPSHHLMLNLLGVCVSGPTGIPHAIMLEYPTFGSLHTFLVTKRRSKASGSTHSWGGLQLELSNDRLVFGVPESMRELLSPLLDDPAVRERPFRQQLRDPICDVDQLLFALQIAHGMKFLTDNNILHKRLCTESVVISHGFYLKLTGVDFDLPEIHQTAVFNTNRLKRTASGRNMLKWDAPEVIDTNEFSEKSEVWRFGMTMWEIASLGDAPFAELPNRIMTEMVKKGVKPSQPESCSKRLYSLMESCWMFGSSERPQFSSLIERINEELRTHTARPLDLLSASPTSTSSVQTTSTSFDINSPGYWSVATPKELMSGRGSIKRPHPCSIPPNSAFRRVSQTSAVSPTSVDQLFAVPGEDKGLKNNNLTLHLLEGYTETDV